MSSRGAHREEEEEDFYDCQDSMETKEEEEKEEELPKTDRIIGRGAKERKRWTEGGGDERERQEEEELQEEEERQEEEELQEEEESQVFQDSDEETSRVEFDDVYLREVEKELTEEEKESRRQQSVALKETGNGLFKAGDWKEAELSYTQALALCPVSCSRERAVMFSNRAAARMHLDLKDQAISDCSRAIDLDPEYLRALLRRAELYEKSEKLDEALEDYRKVLERDPSHSGAQQACMRLPQQIEERNEKLKEEMMGKLKDLGNLILRPFGLSTSNFQVEQDSSSGTFSINFVQNPNNSHTG
ncbi:tetratricopeptide repeat protein 1 [Xiphophorus couchianus]|uniref:tetratricopeptide repeat protein 1 n=1 Tax=Xiphophorus couchianus TaxID=32473 RepID=UPI0010165D1C|nr:tetratricopeptide repeat protein 1 [Xiphophorus couchianus]